MNTDQFGTDRRRFLQRVAAGTGALLTPAVAAPAMAAQPIKYKNAVTILPWASRLQDGLRDAVRTGFQGVEVFPNNVEPYLKKPLVVKKMLDDMGLELCSCSNGGRGFSTNFWDRSQTNKTVEDHVRLAREFLAPFGYVKAFKCNPGGRPGAAAMRGKPPTTMGAAAMARAVTDDLIKIAADTFNRIGEQTLKYGIKVAAHPHCSSLISTQEEARRFIELTDPRYVWFTIDTAHVQLMGFDPVVLLKEQWPRVAEIHYKDLPPTARGNRTYAPPMMGPSAGGHGYWRNMGGADSGGVDFPTIHNFLVAQGYDGWASVDLDGSMLEGKDLGETAAINARYIIDVLKCPLKPRPI